MYIATVALSACGGCENALLAVGEPLVALLSEHTISFSSLLVDRRSVSPSDVVLASGCIRNSEEREVASEIARTSRKIIAVGTCAVYGGICGSARMAGAAEGPEENVLPEVFKVAEPLDSSMAVELYVPGCPPPPNMIFEALKSVVEGYAPLHLSSTVCSDCPRRVLRKSSKTLKTHPGPGVVDDACLLNAGLLCMGPVTRGGCHAACPSQAAACAGCRGPSDAVLSSQLHSLHSDMVAYICRTSGVREDKVAKQLEPMLDILYMFTKRDPVTRAKAKERVPGD
jgi:F420-non-reducing hydrogenase small subunit